MAKVEFHVWESSPRRIHREQSEDKQPGSSIKLETRHHRKLCRAVTCCSSGACEIRQATNGPSEASALPGAGLMMLALYASFFGFRRGQNASLWTKTHLTFSWVLGWQPYQLPRHRRVSNHGRNARSMISAPSTWKPHRQPPTWRNGRRGWTG